MSQQTDPTPVASPTKAQSSIPFYYRLPLLYVEPLCALNGAYMLYNSPRSFLEVVSPHSETYFPIAPSAVSNTSKIASKIASKVVAVPAPSMASVRVLTDMLAGMHLLFAFNLAITLRVAGDDRKLWRVLCSGMLLSDAMHLFATWREFGWPQLADYSSWRTVDWLNFGIMGWMTVVRLGVVAGIGLGNKGSGGDSKKSTPATAPGDGKRTSSSKGSRRSGGGARKSKTAGEK